MRGNKIQIILDIDIAIDDIFFFPFFFIVYQKWGRYIYYKMFKKLQAFKYLSETNKRYKQSK
jgi:hypothetical protein